MDTRYWLGFSIIPGIGRVRFNALEAYFGDLENAWRAPEGELRKAGLDNSSVNSIVSWRPRIDIDAELEKLEANNVSYFTYHEAEYPTRLKQIYDYPPVLFVKGNLIPQDEWSIAVVGTRRATVYGRQVTEEMVADLVASKISIASGLARGIDSVAHRTTLEAGGRTIAVLASGLDIIYPAENAGLAQSITENGALISEYPLGTKPRAENFPRRNRIMSGISLGVLCVEADETSGAIITARQALEQNREVFAVPGSILSPTSRGTNMLIQRGEAKLVTRCMDILEELNLVTVAHQMEMKELLPENETESLLLKQLTAEPVHIDEVCHTAGLPISTVSSTLSMMELKGMVKQVGVMSYVLAREAREEYRIQVE